MAKVKNRRDNHNIKRPKSGAGYGESGGTRELRGERPLKKEAHKKTAPRRQAPSRSDIRPFEKDDNIIIGRNPVTEALKAGREIDKKHI